MKTRIITAIVGILVLIGVLFTFDTLVFNFVIAAITLIAIHEVFKALGFGRKEWPMYAVFVPYTLLIMLSSYQVWRRLVMPASFLMVLFFGIYLVVRNAQVDFAKASGLVMFSGIVIFCFYSFIRLKELLPVVETYRAYQAADSRRREAEELLHDPEMKEMAQDELAEAKEELEHLKEKLTILLLPSDPNDSRNVILEIRGGVGGEESALFAHSLLRMYTMYAQNRGWTLEVLNLNETELGGVKEAIISVDGAGAYNRLKYESGVHRVQRVPETETQGRIHTSTATVAVMPQAEEVDFALDMKDLRIDTFRSSGAGGQHINKTSSAIRVTHIPTGTVVECQNERSQFQNKDKALEILRSRLLAQKQKEQQDAINAQRQGQVGTGDRSEKIRTYNFPQDRCTDHRIGLTVHNLDKIMDGNLDEIIDALATHEQAEKLRQLNAQAE